ncbi:hypothetical protein Gotur_022142 [Gossypium turneri]
MASSSPRTVEEIFKDYSARRSGLVRALTYDVDDFYSQCDPGKLLLIFFVFNRSDSILNRGVPFASACDFPLLFQVSDLRRSLDFNLYREFLFRSFLCQLFDLDAELFSFCLFDHKENLCLYGHPNEAWEVALPAEEVPPELPEPALGINFARDGMNRKDWLSLVAVHSDCWLLSVSFYFGARLNRNERKRLFSMINDLPTVFEVVTGRKPIKDKPTVESGSKSRNSTKVNFSMSPPFTRIMNAIETVKCKLHNFIALSLVFVFVNLPFASQRSIDGQPRSNPKLVDENYEEDEEEQGDTFCGICGGGYNSDEFWIGCDNCERWYHGKCVKITPAKAELIKFYKCPLCTKKARQ